jgi:hypothetical protein
LNELQTSIISQLKEIADDYKLAFGITDDCQFIYFTKVETYLCDPAFMLVVEWNVNKVMISNLGKTIDLKDLVSCVRLLAEVIS